MIPIWPHCVFLSTQELVSEEQQRGRFFFFDSVWKGHRRAGALMRRDDQVLSLLSLKGFPLFSCIKDSLIGLRTPCRCYQLAKKKKKKEEESHVGAQMHTITYVRKERLRWLKESKRHFGWRNNICRRRVTWRGLWGNMFALLSLLFFCTGRTVWWKENN